MKITAAMAASLNILTAALDDPGADITHSLDQLTLEATAAIPTYLGLSMLVPQSNPPFTISTLAAGVVDGDIRTSLRVRLPIAGAGDGLSVAVIFYAGAPGAFVDLAADLTWLTGRPPADFTLDQHLGITSWPDTTPKLQAVSEINQAIGVLIGRGYSPQQASWELDAQAMNNRTDRHSVARLILDKITSDGDGHFDMY
ncbi:ANTAR domain-containing protein [Mycolicibacterium komossense]|uniref:ANTAR domain-containing protein n=1 Tax=Mycolicibacterium komossense TaxID=1779 RepID=A0ABT3CJE0_9MYCO|nr:ANTAR domain-containing protein [Mycolicibacterium komossense]MCV7229564.1 ANTAR domain-containing protein [Mycolicibacterium komossense]